MSSLELTVLGSSGGYAGAGKACSGYLVRAEGRNLVVDLGSGALSNLLLYLSPDTVEGIVISHLHYDHYIDIYGLLTARRFWGSALPPLPVFAPRGAGDLLASIVSERSRREFLGCIELRTLEDGAALEVSGLRVVVREVEHIKDSYCFRIECGGRSLCYSGDTDRCSALLESSRGVDLFLCESTFTSEVPRKEKGHLSASEAGRIAAEAGAGRLLLTHIWPTLSAQRALEDAGEEFRGDILVAEEGMAVDV